VATGLGLAQNPLVLPFAERGAAEARAAVEAAMARRVDAAWLLPRLETAIADADVDRTELYLDLADSHGVAVPGPLLSAAMALVAPPVRVRLAQCSACALNPADCHGVTQIMSCALPLELTPIGDANALRRQFAEWREGRQVDMLEVNLALLGLSATALVPLSGGSSATVKAGSTVARLAHLSGRLTPRFSRSLREAADVPVAWDRVDDFALGRVDLDAVVDTARLSRLGDMASDFGTLHRNTSAGDALALLHHVHDPSDLARLARLSDTARESTRPAVETLGLARAVRATTRVSDLVIGVLAALAALAVQVAGLAASLALRRIRQGLARR
jgi:hypothetical protein